MAPGTRLEVCVDNIEAVLRLNALASGGLSRLEICGPLSAGGTTPSVGFVRRVAALTQIPFRVMLRPREGNFAYSPAEFAVLLEDAEILAATLEKSEYCEGFVVGICDQEGALDVARVRAVAERFKHKRFTLHRVVDVCVDSVAELAAKVTQLPSNVDTILTSGRSMSGVADGLEVIHELRARLSALGRGTEVMLGAGVRPATVGRILSSFSAENPPAWLHGSFSPPAPNSLAAPWLGVELESVSAVLAQLSPGSSP